MTGTQHNIGIVVTGLDQGGTALLKKVQGDFQGVQRAAERAGGQLVTVKEDVKGVGTASQRAAQTTGMAFSKIAMGIGVATAAAYAAKKGFDFAEEGAQLELIETQAIRMAETIGTSWTQLDQDIDQATKGMMSRSERTAGALDLIKLGLAKSHDEAVRLTRVAGLLDMNMNQLVLTLTNKTTMRFDALGLSVDGFNERVSELKETMSEDEAWKMAFLEQAENKLDQLGDIADETAGTFKILRSNWLDYVNSVKINAASASEPIIKGLNGILESAVQVADMLHLLEGAQRDGIITTEELGDMQFLLEMGYMAAGEAADILRDREEMLANAAEAAAADHFTLAQSIDAADKAMLGYAITADETKGELWGLVEATDSFDIAERNQAERTAELNALLDRKKITLQDVTDAYEDQRQAIRDAYAAGLDYVSVFEGNRWEDFANIVDTTSQFLFDQAIAYADNSEKQGHFLAALAELNPELAESMELSQLYGEYLDVLGEGLASGAISAEEFFQGLDDIADASLDNIDQIQELNEEITNLKALMRKAESESIAAASGIVAAFEMIGVEGAIPTNEKLLELTNMLPEGETRIKTSATNIAGSFGEIVEGAEETITQIEKIPDGVGDVGKAFDHLKDDNIQPAYDLTESWFDLMELNKSAMIMSIEEIAGTLDTGLNRQLARALGMAGGIYSKIMALDGLRVNSYIYIHTIGGGGGGTSTRYITEMVTRKYVENNIAVTDDASLIGTVGPGEETYAYHSGADFVVPPGYPNDSFGPVYLESGEHVKVTPAGRADRQSGGGIVIQNVNLYGVNNPREMFDKIEKEARMRGKQFSAVS